MLTKREKQEFIEDGVSFKRRRDLAQSKTAGILSGRALDELLKFLKEIREFSSAEHLLSDRTVTRSNKL